MNMPSINPQLRKVERQTSAGDGQITDYVFVIRENDIADVECYIDDKWNREETMKGMSVQNARDWWKTLVHKGYERVLTP